MDGFVDERDENGYSKSLEEHLKAGAKSFSTSEAVP
jgi:hypothetical protein